MKNFKNKKTLQIVLLVVIAVVTLGIGYAAISAINLIINGNASGLVDQNNFKVHFTQAQAISGSTGVSGTSTIDSQDDTKATFDVTGLTKVGDYAEAVYTVRNDSNGIGAEITLNLESSNTEYFKVTETILDDKLQAGEETTAKVKVEMIKTPITDSVSTTITATLTASPLENETATGGSSASVEPIPDPVSFSTDSWATIQKAVQNNNTSMYNIGDTKIVTINNTDYQVRIANKSTPVECNNTDYSQTACGFVVEFTDIVGLKSMNSTGTNIGGWPGSELYTYLQGPFYDNLPSDLKNNIIRTKVISGHGRTDQMNFISNDYMYLLSNMEVLGEVGDCVTTLNTSRQLDIYEINTIITPTPWGGESRSNEDAIKYYNNLPVDWWLRSADNCSGSGDMVFRTISSSGSQNARTASDDDVYFSPAFRIG